MRKTIENLQQKEYASTETEQKGDPNSKNLGDPSETTHQEQPKTPPSDCDKSKRRKAEWSKAKVKEGAITKLKIKSPSNSQESLITKAWNTNYRNEETQTIRTTTKRQSP